MGNRSESINPPTQKYGTLIEPDKSAPSNHSYRMTRYSEVILSACRSVDFR